MIKKRNVLAIMLAGLFGLFAANFASAELLNTPEENAEWLGKGVKHTEMAIAEAKQSNGDKSVQHGEEAQAALKEINSEGWAAMLGRGRTSIRYGIKAAKKGEFDKAVKEYEDAIAKLKTLKAGDMGFTHDSFF